MPLKVKQDIESSINLTPLIDIVFLLIIFFMVGTKFSELNEIEKNIALQVPSVSNAQALTAAPKHRVINVLEDGIILLDEQKVSLEQLATELENASDQYQNLGVVIRGDENAIYKHIATVMATCRLANISDLNIAVRTATQSQNNLK